ncbi:hypothetical protein GGF37_004162 [Kickxella alabastrina]|nr:hypothetical protein GGF37_004162 [Kickxella alabastrina]
MRVKRTKAYKKAMQFYRQVFNFRAPYQVLLSPDFILACVQKNIEPVKSLEEALQGPIKPFLTFCAISDVRKESEFRDKAVAISKTFEKRRCPHKDPIEATQCMAEIMGKENKNNLCVAVQDDNLRLALRRVPGVPILYLQRNVVVMERIKEVGKEVGREISREKMGVSEAEKKMLRIVKRKEIEEKVAGKRRKVKGPKAPNPLSVKKQAKSVKTAKPAVKNNPPKDTHAADQSSSLSSNKRPRLEEPSAAAPGSTDTGESQPKQKRKRNRSKKNKSETEL